MKEQNLPELPANLAVPPIQGLVSQMLTHLGEDVSREGLVGTPDRVAKSMAFLTSGYQLKVEDVINNAIFTEECDDMVIVKNIEFYSMCEHHMLPFFGRCHIGYIPRGKVIGVSKMARIVDMFARRFQVQERLTNQIADVIRTALNPEGVGVVVEAQHLCMLMRGVEKQNSVMVTSCMLDSFREEAAARAEFLSLIKS